jgi:putative membrane protein
LALIGSILGYLSMSLLASWSVAPGSWEVAHHLETHWAILGIILGFCSGWLLGARVAPGWRWLYRPREVNQAVETAAWTLFGLHQVSHTAEGVGVLIYLSVTEHRLTVLADRGAFRVLGAAGLKELRDLGLQGLAQGRKAEAIVEVVRLAAQRLREAYPHQDNDQNELSDHVLVVHPFPRGM